MCHLFHVIHLFKFPFAYVFIHRWVNVYFLTNLFFQILFRIVVWCFVSLFCSLQGQVSITVVMPQCAPVNSIQLISIPLHNDSSSFFIHIYALSLIAEDENTLILVPEMPAEDVLVWRRWWSEKCLQLNATTTHNNADVKWKVRCRYLATYTTELS